MLTTLKGNLRIFGGKLLSAPPGVSAGLIAKYSGFSDTKFLSVLGEDSSRLPQGGNCVSFNGTNQYVTAPHLDLFNDSTNPFKITVVFNPDSVSGTKRIGGQQEGGLGYGGVSVYTSGTDLRLDIISTLTNRITVSATGLTLSIGTTYTAVIEYDGSQNASGITFTVNDVAYGTTISNDTLTVDDITTVEPFSIACTKASASGELFNDGKVSTFSVESEGTLYRKYKLDETTGDIAFDSSGNENHGTYTNAPTHTQDSTLPYSYQNQVGYSRRTYFDGVDDNIVIPNSGTGGSNAIDLNGSFEISFDFVPFVSQSAYLINNYQGTGGNVGKHITIHIDPLGAGVSLEASIDDNVNVTSVISSELDLNTLYSCRLVRDKGNTLKIYVNEIEEDSNTDITTGSVLSNQEWVFGARAQDTAEEQFNGILDNIKFYDTTSTLIHSWQGYGAEDWNDTVGTAHGTVTSATNINIPRDESNITKDVLGNDLQYSGKVKNNALLKGSNCISLDGTNQYAKVETIGDVNRVRGWFKLDVDDQEIITLDNTTGKAIKVSSGAISFGGDLTRIFTKIDDISYTNAEAGAILNDNDWHYIDFKFDDGLGSPLSATDVRIGTDSSAYGDIQFAGVQLLEDDTERVNFSTAEGVGYTVYDISGNDNHATLFNSPTWTTQDAYHYNITNGFTKAYQNAEFPINTSATKYSFKVKTTQTQVLFFDNFLTNGNYLGVICHPGQSSEGLYNGTSITIDGVAPPNTQRDTLSGLICDGEEHEIVVEGATFTGWTKLNLEYTGVWELTNGGVWDVKLDDVKLTPTSITRLIRLPKTNTLTNPASVGHNDAETTIDFKNIALGNTVPPETNHLAEDTDFTAFSFGADTGWDTYDYAFYREASDIKNDRFLIYEEDLTGSNLTRAERYTGNN